jgi:hypothetical protein
MPNGNPCNNLNLLRLYKIYPKIDNFNYMRYQFYIYIYLDPFEKLDKPFKIKAPDNKDYCSAYTPIYVGKASRGAGYRHNQHIQSYLKNKENNVLKIKKFKEIEKNMAYAKKHNLIGVPHDWKEYQLNWIVIHQSFNDAKKLLDYEVKLIQTLGTQYKRKGPLVNKIEN